MKKRYSGIDCHGKLNFMDEKKTLCDNNRGYCGVYGEKDLMADMTPFVIQMTNSLSVGQAMSDRFTGLPRYCVARNDGANTRFFGLRPLNDGVSLQEILRFAALNDGRTMHNEQNGLVLMFSSPKQHKAQETKPDSNRNISTCVAQREVA